MPMHIDHTNLEGNSTVCSVCAPHKQTCISFVVSVYNGFCRTDSSDICRQMNPTHNNTSRLSYEYLIIVSALQLLVQPTQSQYIAFLIGKCTDIFAGRQPQ